MSVTEPDPRYVVPEHLVEEILAGRCAAFVGAGFSAPAVPGWRGFLEAIAARLPAREETLDETIRTASSALDYELAGQMIRDRFDDASAFECAVAEVLEASSDERAEGLRRVQARLRLLRGVPFEAILTTNVDNFLYGRSPTPQVYEEILRRDLRWWARADWNTGEAPRSPVVKLHGDANRDPSSNPVVLARGDYRRLLYEEGRYSNFLRAIFATRTILFLGVSFTDAYLNELRSEILALLRGRGERRRFGGDRPLWYAVLADRTPAWARYFESHEGIRVLNFSTEPDADGSPTSFEGFDEWLYALHAKTSAEARLRALLAGRNVVWLDPTPINNALGVGHLRRAGARVLTCTDPAELSAPLHADAALIITHFGYRGPDRPPVAVQALRALNVWPSRPPVIVFATGYHARANRQTVLRQGAWEYAWSWQELFRLIEELFGRQLGE